MPQKEPAMDPRQINEEAIFKVAVKIESVEARTAYLNQICAGDSGLLERVLTLLRAHDDEAEFLERPAANFPATVDLPPIKEREGSLIGPYKLLQAIGEGGFGVVYMAEQTRPVRRKVALKIIKPGMDTKEVVARFEAERQALALMDHPNIAKVLDAGTTDSQLPYFVMELVKGVPLTEYCDKNHLPTRERLKLFIDVCHAIQHAHQKGVIHRDLKPSNIMVTLHDGQPVAKVIDFGVSKALSQQLTEKTLFTAYGQMVGTPAYMSPEQAEMSGLDIDTRSDVYSLGVLLYELLTGTTPFDGKRLRSAGYVEMQRIIREEEPPRPSTRLTSLGDSATVVSGNRGTDPKQLGQLLRGELDWIVMRALEKDRNRRYETANGLAADVIRYLNDEPVVACPPTAAYRLHKFARRYRAQVTVAAAFSLLLLASSALAWWLYADARVARNAAVAARDDLKFERDRALDAEREAERESKAAKLQRDRAETETKRADENAEELKLRLYDYNLIKAQSAYEQKDFGQTLRMLMDCRPEQRGWEWHRLQRLCGVQRTLQVRSVGDRVTAVSPTEPRCVVFDDATGTYRVVDLETGEELASVATGLKSHRLPVFSSSGKLVAVIGTGLSEKTFTTVQVWNITSGKKVWDTTCELDLAVQPAFSPDGRYLAFGSVEQNKTLQARIYLIDIERHTQIWQYALPGQRGVPLVAFDSNGDRLYSVVSPSLPPCSEAILSCWSTEGPTELWSVSNVGASMPCPTPDGTHVITGGSTHSFRIFSADDGQLIEAVSGDRPDDAVYFVFSPDGRYLISMGHLGHRLIWDWDGRRIVDSLPTTGKLSDKEFEVAFSPTSDQMIITSDSGVIEFMDLNFAPAHLTLAGHEQEVKGVAFSPDGQQVASVSRDGTLRLWNAATGQETATLVAHPSAFDLVYSPDGKYIATGGQDGAMLWYADTGQVAQNWTGNSQCWWIDFSPGSDQVITGGPGSITDNLTKGCLSLYSVDRDKCELTVPTRFVIDGLSFCGDGRRAVSIGFQSGQLDVWDLKAGEAHTIRPGVQNERYYRCVVRSPRSNQVAVVVEDSIELWDIDSQQLIKTLPVNDETPYCLAFNQDGSRLFAGDIRGTVKLWNLETGEILFTMPAHEPTSSSHERERLVGVLSLALSLDGKTLATAGADGLVKLWETTHPSKETAEQRRVVSEASDAVNQLYRISPRHRDVMASLSAVSSLDPAVAKMAREIANTRGDRPRGPFIASSASDTTERVGFDIHEQLNGARRSLAKLVEQVSRADFDAVNPDSPTECDGRWVWNVNSQIIAAFKLDELECLLDPLVNQYPEAHQFLCLRGFVHSHQRRYEEAEADFRAALERVPEKTELWITYAYVLSTLYVHQGDFDRYRDLSERVLQQALEMFEPRIFELAAKTYLLSPHGGKRTNDAVRLAHAASTSTPNGIYRWLSLAAGMAEYRRGNWELAIEILNQAMGESTRDATSYLFQALSYARLNQRQRADEMRAAAEEIMRQPDFGQGEFWNAFIAQAAYGELQHLLANASENAPAATSPDNDFDSSRRAQRIIAPHADWKWLHPAGGADPATEDADFHTTFFSLSYDDNGWQAGTDSPGPVGGFGYGDPAGVELEVPAAGMRHTAYFRHHFTTDQAYDELILAMQRDDGVIIYLDGEEVGRNNVGNAAETYSLHAQQVVVGDQETWVGFYPVRPPLEPGEHVLAISLHNSSAESSDLRLADISLWGIPRRQPDRNEDSLAK